MKKKEPPLLFALDKFGRPIIQPDWKVYKSPKRAKSTLSNSEGGKYGNYIKVEPEHNIKKERVNNRSDKSVVDLIGLEPQKLGCKAKRDYKLDKLS